jgi:hypothetical protein
MRPMCDASQRLTVDVKAHETVAAGHVKQQFSVPFLAAEAFAEMPVGLNRDQMFDAK